MRFVGMDGGKLYFISLYLSHDINDLRPYGGYTLMFYRIWKNWGLDLGSYVQPKNYISLSIGKCGVGMSIGTFFFGVSQL